MYKVLVIAVVITVTVVMESVVAQNNGQGNPGSGKVEIANTNDTNVSTKPGAGQNKTLEKNSTATVPKSTKSPTNGAKRRRNGKRNGRQRKRTQRQRKRNNKMQKLNADNDAFTASTKVPVQQTKVIPKKAKAKEAQSNPSKKADKTQDDFFNLFDEVTTAVTPQGPPPDFDPNSKRVKVMPTVDTRGSKAHDGTPCNMTYKPHESDPTKYMMRYAEGVWETLDCPPNLATGLVWRQDLCSCGERLVAQDPDDWCAQMGFNPHPDNKHKYMRRHHGVDAVMDCAANLVWSQKNCLCSYDPTVKERPMEQKVSFVCKTILDLKFEGNLKNKAEGYNVKTVNLRRRGKLPRIRYIKTPGSTARAAMIVSQPLEFQAFKGNDFQTQVTYSVNFKISPRHLNRKNPMTLFTDECIGNQNRERKPGISLSFRPDVREFRLQFRTELVEIDELIPGAKPDQNGWYRTVLYFEDKTLNLEVNGVKLYTAADVTGKIPQNKCPLYIAGRGIGFDRSQDFYGYLDNVFLVKDCKFHEANIKIL